MRAAYIEGQAGASGDMFLGAWLDLGIDEGEWRRLLHSLDIEGVEISVHTVFKQGIRGTKVDVSTTGELYPDLQKTPIHDHHHDDQGHDHHHDHHHHDDHHHDHHHHDHHHHDHHHHDHDHHEDHHHDHDHDDHHHHDHDHVHRGLVEIEAILDGSDIPGPVRDKSKEAFRHLARAEGAIHGMPPEEVHFHEVGALDAIVDIVGAMTGWYLAGMPVCYVSPIEVGGGTVDCAHGRMPVPAPATAALLHGFETYSSGTWGETVTPTGAAIIRTLCKQGRRPAMRFDAVGYGAGTKDFHVANVLRIQLGEVTDADRAEIEPERETAVVLEANIDDMSPEWIGYALERLLKAGALDAWVTPVLMKKGRPGHVLQVLAEPEQRQQLEHVMFEETTTIGLRSYSVERKVLARTWSTVTTAFGDVRVKLAYVDGQPVNVAPEYEDCRKIAADHGVPLKRVYQQVYAAFFENSEGAASLPREMG